MKIAVHVAETHSEGRVSQNFDIGLSFCFILCRKMDFQSCPFLALKMRLGPK